MPTGKLPDRLHGRPGTARLRAAGATERERLLRLHESVSGTIRRTMLTLIAFSLFCVLTALGTPDVRLIVPSADITIPFADMPMPFVAFLIVAPLVLLTVTLYLHIFLGRWHELERRIGPDSDLRAPTLFNLRHPLAAPLTIVIFYVLTPATLFVIAWKAAGRPDYGPWLLTLAALTAAVLAQVLVNRAVASKGTPLAAVRHWALLPAALFGFSLLAAEPLIVREPVETGEPQTMGALLEATWFRHETEMRLYERMRDYERAYYRFHRPLDLFRADLGGQWLVGSDLRKADLRLANLDNANLWGARLDGANLFGTRLDGANLRGARLDGADLRRAGLNGADLYRAQLDGADLTFARLHGANLSRARLYGANLSFAQLYGADLSRSRMSGVKLDGTELTGADMRYALLRGTDLASARLDGVDMREALLEGANLERVSMNGADLLSVGTGTYTQEMYRSSERVISYSDIDTVLRRQIIERMGARVGRDTSFAGARLNDTLCLRRVSPHCMIVG